MSKPYIISIYEFVLLLFYCMFTCLIIKCHYLWNTALIFLCTGTRYIFTDKSQTVRYDTKKPITNKTEKEYNFNE